MNNKIHPHTINGAKVNFASFFFAVLFLDVEGPFLVRTAIGEYISERNKQKSAQLLYYASQTHLVATATNLLPRMTILQQTINQ